MCSQIVPRRARTFNSEWEHEEARLPVDGVVAAVETSTQSPVDSSVTRLPRRSFGGKVSQKAGSGRGLLSKVVRTTTGRASGEPAATDALTNSWNDHYADQVSPVLHLRISPPWPTSRFRRQ